MQYIAYLIAISLANFVVLRPMLFPRYHPRYVSPAVVADIPNTTFRGGLL